MAKYVLRKSVSCRTLDNSTLFSVTTIIITLMRRKFTTTIITVGAVIDQVKLGMAGGEEWEGPATISLKAFKT